MESTEATRDGAVRLDLRTLLVPVESIDAGLQFYQRGLGLRLKFRDGDRYAALEGEGITVALAIADEQPVADTVCLAFKTDDLEAAIARLADAGAEILVPPKASAHETQAVLRAPGGGPIVVYSPWLPSRNQEQPDETAH